MKGNARAHPLTFAASFAVVFITFQLSLTYALNADSWYFLFHPDRLTIQHARTARPILAAAQSLLDLLHINIVQAQLWDGLIGILLVAAALDLLQRALLNRAPAAGRSLTFLVAFAITVNPFLCEWFANSFVSPFTCLTQLLCVFAAILLAEAQLKPLRVGLAFAFIVLSAGIFQSPLSLAVPLTIALMALAGAPAKQILRRAALGLIALATGAVTAYAFARLSTRLIGIGPDVRLQQLHPLAALKQVLGLQPEVWITTFTLIPRYSFLLATLLAAGFLLFSATGKQAKLIAITASVLLIAFTFAPHIVTAYVWVTPRSVTSLCAILGILAMPFLTAPPGRTKCGIVALLSVWALIVVASSNRVLSDYLANYRLDLEEAGLIWNEIRACESKTGTKIKGLAAQLDRAPTWCRPGIRCSGDFNVRAIVKFYAQTSMLRSASGGRIFERVPNPPPLQQIFGRDNWDSFSPGEVRCIGNTAFLAIY